MKRQFEEHVHDSTSRTKSSVENDQPPKKRQKLNQTSKVQSNLSGNGTKTNEIAALSASTLLSSRKYQKTPIIYVNSDDKNEERPLLFGEPILDTLGVYTQHETFVKLRQ